MTITVGTSAITFPDSTTQVTAARSGATATSSGTDITLTSSSNQVQAVTMTAANLNVILPSATTMAALGTTFVISAAASSYYFNIKNNAGSIVAGPIQAGTVAFVTLQDNSTSAGVWNIQTTAVQRGNAAAPSVSTIGLYPSGTTNFMQVVALSSTLAVASYYDTTGALYIVALSVSGTTVTYGTPVLVVAAATGTSTVNLVAHSATLGCVVANANVTSYNAYIWAFTVSGTTITLGASTLLNSGGGNYIPGAYAYKNSATTGLAVYPDGTNSYIFLQAYSVSGTTVTLGTQVNIATSTSNTWPLAFTGSNQFVIGYQDSGQTNRITFKAGTISGNTITMGAASYFYSPYTGGNVLSQFYGAFSPSANVAHLASTQLNGPSYLVTQSGTTISGITVRYEPGAQLAVPPQNFVSGANLAPSTGPINTVVYNTNGLSVAYFNAGGMQGTGAVLGLGFVTTAWTCVLDTDTVLTVSAASTSTAAYLQSQIVKVV